STGVSTASQSWVSCGETENAHTSFPVSGFSATIEQVYGLSPGRVVPFNTGVGLPVPQYRRLSSGSYVPVIHVIPPVVWFGVPGGGVESHWHCVAPVSGSMERR